MQDDIKRAILLDHYEKPRNRGSVNDDRYDSIHNASDSCIDDITVQMLIEDNIIKDVKYDGKGCTICISSCSIISDLLIGKTLEEGLNIINNYYNMIDEKEFDIDLLEEANAFDTLSKQANRIKCGTIGIHAMEDIIKSKYGK